MGVLEALELFTALKKVNTVVREMLLSEGTGSAVFAKILAE